MDSSAIHERAYLSTFRKHKISINFKYAEFAGKSTAVVMKDIVNLLNLEDDLLPNLINFKQNLTRKYFLELQKPIIFPGVEEGLSELSKKYRLALCTSASKATMDFFFESGISKKLFDILINSNDVYESKPNPYIYLKAMSELKIEHVNCTVVEDSLAGVQAGLLSGANVVHIGPIEIIQSIHKSQGLKVRNYLNFRDFSADYLRI